jgi:hypothetical protein
MMTQHITRKSGISLLLTAFLAFAITFTLSCSSDDDPTPRGGGRNYGEGYVPASVIPDAIYAEFKNAMPIYSGTTPPDISGEYLVDGMILAGSNVNGDKNYIGSHYSSNYKAWADLYVAFIKGEDGKLSYRDRNGTSQGASDNVIVKVVGNSNDFTAYFESETINESEGTRIRRSNLISGTLVSDGISNCHHAFIVLEKTDPKDELMDVDTYRIFKDGDGLAERHVWLSKKVLTKEIPSTGNLTSKTENEK